MPILWDIQAEVFCDVTGCNAKLTVAGQTQREAVHLIKSSGWLYRKNSDGDLQVRCPDHVRTEAKNARQ